MIDELPRLTSDSRRSQRTIARCHERLERSRAAARGSARYRVERSALFGFGVIYMAAIAASVLNVLFR